MPAQTIHAAARVAETELRHGATRRRRERGQVMVIFAGAMIALVALMAVVVDVAWYWTNNLRMQRAADAAALAGVVWLPGNTGQAYTVARAEAAKNGYANGVDGVVVTPVQDSTNPRRLKVSITGPVGTFFAKAVGINSWPAARSAKADYVLPVPMGSPDNYYGVGYWVKPDTHQETHTTTSDNPGNTMSNNFWLPAGGPVGAGSAWATPASATGQTTGNPVNNETGNDNSYTTASTNNSTQAWDTFRLLATGNPPGSPTPRIPTLAGNQTLAIDGIQVRLVDVGLGGTGTGTTNCRVGVELSWNGGGNWSDQNLSNAVTNTSANPTTDLTVGSTNSMSAWGGHDWLRSEFGNSEFRVRLTWIRGATGCNANRTLKLDLLEVRVFYTVTTTTTTTTTVTTLIDDAPVPPPAGQSAITRPQKFWGAMQSQGAPSIQGDAFMTKYEYRPTGTLNTASGADPDARYDYVNYYNYAVEIPAGGGGALWIFDPGLCDGSASTGTGEYYTTGSPNGTSSVNPVSSYFDLWYTKETLLDQGDDDFIAGTGTDYRRLEYEDKAARTAAGAGTDGSIADCGPLSWHFGWVQLASGLEAGTYRLHTYSTDTGSPNDQNNATALNAFSMYVSSASGSPRIYGLGAMEAYVRLPGGQASEFYLAQIEKVHAGKTMVINLWDPGDTGALSATLSILMPTDNLFAFPSGYRPATFDYQGTVGTTSSGVSACGSRSGSGVQSVTTNTGGSSLYNGCWLTIEVQLPNDYNAPTDPASGEDGWWKIKYVMGGSAGSFSTDLTTWKVDIRGNPVHLVLP